MGSALGGIYTPILSILTLYMIYRQLRLQASIHVDQMSWQKRQVERQHGLYLCEKLKEELGNSKAQEKFLETLKRTSPYTSINTELYLEFTGKDDISMLLQQLITLLRKLRFCETGKEIRFHLVGLAYASVGIENLNNFEKNLLWWHDMHHPDFTTELCVFTDKQDVDSLREMAE
ncbi:hypothetical protein RUL28_004531 [Vibrio parahaemolyticus]|nr:hypothetical protein [Vibrio parahaemolyticus]